MESETRTPIAFAVEAAAAPSDVVQEEEAKLKSRSERFGTSYSDGDARRVKFGDVRETVRKAQLSSRTALAVGFDTFSQEEEAKRLSRGARFGTAAEGGVEAPRIRVAAPNEEEAQKKERAERFGLEYSAPDPTGLERAGLKRDILFEDRTEVADVVPRRMDTVHVYGVDLMSTKDLLSYFGDYAPTYVEWINDSSCNVCFADEFSSVRAIVGLGEVLAPTDTPDGQGGLSVGDVSQIAYLWHKTHVPFHKAGVDVPLMFRTATDADVKNFTGRHQSRYLWKLPVKKALKVVEHKEAGVSEKRKHDLYDNDGDINMEDAEAGDGGAEGGRKKKRRSKKDRALEAEAAAADGTAAEDAPGPRGRGRGIKGQVKMEAEPARRGGEKHSFYHDDRGDGAEAMDAQDQGPHSFFLNEGAEDEMVGEPFKAEIVDVDGKPVMIKPE